MEPFKNEFSETFVKELGSLYQKLEKGFDKKKFLKEILDENWESRELKDRMRHITKVSSKYLPRDYLKALGIVKKAAPHFSGLKGMVFPDFVEVNGLEKKYRKQSLKALKELTPLFSSEFAIRPFLVNDLKGTLKEMEKWSRDKNEHIRRLASEGCRPRLPWGIALPELKKDPSPLWNILENLKSDSSEYVRRSVANNLNDITKDHPELVFRKIKSWVGKSSETDKLVKHALRTLLKKGDSKAMKLFGYGDTKKVSLKNIQIENKIVAIGEKLNFKFDLEIKSPMRIRFEYAVYFLLKNGEFGKKVFKISEKEVGKGRIQVKRSHNFKPISTRTYYPGKQRLAVIINGHEYEALDFKLVEEKPQWWVYMLQTDQGKLYTGITTDLERRFNEHASGKGSKYLRGKSLNKMVFTEKSDSRSKASKREAAIKKLSKKQKLALIREK